MWWREDSWVPERLDGLLTAWRRRELPFVTAIGSTWTRDGERTLLLGVERERDPRSYQWAPGPGPVDALSRALIRLYGPVPALKRAAFAAEEASLEEGVVAATPVGRLRRVIRQLLSARSGFERDVRDVLFVPLPRADERTRAELGRFELPNVTQIAYLGRVRPLRRSGRSLFRRVRTRATSGCLLTTDAGTQITTAGHLGALKGETVFGRLIFRFLPMSPVGAISAVTSPDFPDSGSRRADGVDIATVSAKRAPSAESSRLIHKLADPSQLRFDEFVRWNGGRTGHHEGRLVGTATEMNEPDRPYRHSVLILGLGSAGRGGDSGSAVFTADGSLIGHMVGTHGAYRHGAYPMVWVQVIDVARDYIEERLGPIRRYRGDLGH